VDDDDANQNKAPTFEVPCEVWLAIDKDTADATGGTTFIEKVRKAFHGRVQGGATYEEPDIQIVGNNVLFHYAFSVTALGCGT